MHIAHIVHQCQHSCQLRPFILLPEHVLDLLSELPGDLILRLVLLPVHHLVTLVNHLAALVKTPGEPSGPTDPTEWKSHMIKLQ